MVSDSAVHVHCTAYDCDQNHNGHCQSEQIELELQSIRDLNWCCLNYFKGAGEP